MTTEEIKSLSVLAMMAGGLVVAISLIPGDDDPEDEISEAENSAPEYIDID